MSHNEICSIFSGPAGVQCLVNRKRTLPACRYPAFTIFGEPVSLPQGRRRRQVLFAMSAELLVAPPDLTSQWIPVLQSAVMQSDHKLYLYYGGALLCSRCHLSNCLFSA